MNDLGRKALPVVMVAIALPIAIAIGARALGNPTLIIKGRSMGSAVPLGGLAVGAWKAPAEVAVGDVILIEPATGAPFVHRVVDRVQENAVVRVRTRGDANQTLDVGWTTLRAKTLRVVFTMPYMGYLLAFVASKVGVALLFIAVPAIALLLAIRQQRSVGGPSTTT